MKNNSVHPIKFLPHAKVIEKRVAISNAHLYGPGTINRPKIKSIQIDGKLNEPGVAAKLTEVQKETLRNIIKMTYNEAVRDGGKSETVVINE